MKFRCGKTVTGLILGSFFVAFPALATSYSYGVDVQFNFNSKLGVTITDADIKILDLAPGTSADSNIVGITISTNNVAGYTAEATVGNAQNATTNMTHTNGTNTFTSIATDASQASLTTDNTWGYAISTDNGSSWSNFSGLPVYTEDGKQLASTDSPASDAIQFKINAKAATSQPAGDYTNVINFKVVANTPPRDWKDVLPPDYCTTHPTECDTETNLPKIQAINEDICEAVETYDTQLQVTDSRDHKNYWISKLRDGNCWMTQNLDLDLDSTRTYTNADTDLGWNGVKYTTASWKPDVSTVNGQSSIVFESKSTEPYSIDIGDWYQNSQWFESYACSLYDPDDRWNCSQWYSRNPTEPSGTHSHLGNYYNWTAAIAMNDSSSYSGVNSFEDISLSPTTSICPAGWRLPHVTYTSSYELGQSDIWHLLWYYNGKQNNSDRVFLTDPMYFVRGGNIDGNYIYPGYNGWYWAAESFANAYMFRSGYISVGGSVSSSILSSVRCLARTKNPYTITFNANEGTGMMTSQQIKRGSSAKLSANTFTREGYYFNGWNTKADGKGEGYGDKELYEVASSNEQAGVTLYAQWTTTRTCTKNCDSDNPAYESGITIQRAYELAYTEHHLGMYEETAKGNGIYERVNSWPPDNESYKGYDVRFAMQDIDLTYNGVKVCDLVTVIGDQYQALDIRDNKLYYIAKLADGRCWMTQNLDLDLDSNKALTSETSDINIMDSGVYSGGYSIDGNNVISWLPERSTSDDKGTFEGSLFTGYRHPYSIDFSDVYEVYDSGTLCDFTETTCANFASAPPAINGEHGHVGNYYNMNAAVATNDSDAQGGYREMENSICPKNWKLPYASGAANDPTSEIGVLASSYGLISGTTGSSVAWDAPLYYVHNGSLSWDDMYHPGDIGEYWSNAFVDGYYHARLYTVDFDNKLNQGTASWRAEGKGVRCLAR